MRSTTKFVNLLVHNSNVEYVLFAVVILFQLYFIVFPDSLTMEWMRFYMHMSFLAIIFAIFLVMMHPMTTYFQVFFITGIVLVSFFALYTAMNALAKKTNSDVVPKDFGALLLAFLHFFSPFVILYIFLVDMEN